MSVAKNEALYLIENDPEAAADKLVRLEQENRLLKEKTLSLITTVSDMLKKVANLKKSMSWIPQDDYSLGA
jgi:predicted nuclease with TOPRIM domain